MLKRALCAATALALLSGAAFAQTYKDSAGTAIPAFVPITPGVGPLFTSSNPGQIAGTFSASLSGFQPTPAYSQLTVGAASTHVALPSGTVVIVYNTGANAAYVQLGNSSVAATAANDVIQPNSWMAFTVGSAGYIAAIETAGATALNISGGAGLPTGAGGGGGSSGSVPTGSAGTPSTSVVTVQGIVGGIAQPVSGTVTANAGTNMSTAALALESGGNLAGINGKLTTTANGLKVDGSGVTQPVSGSVSIAGTPSVSISGTPVLGAGSNTIGKANVLGNSGAVLDSAAGTPNYQAITIQGNAGGVPVPVTGTFSANLGGFTPTPSYSYQSVTTSSAPYALPTGTTVVVYNTGASAITFKLGASGVSVAAGQAEIIQPNAWMAFTVGTNTYYAVVGAGASSVVVSGGAGLPTGAGGGGGSSNGGAFGIGLTASTLPSYSPGLYAYPALTLNGATYIDAVPGGALLNALNTGSYTGTTTTLSSFFAYGAVDINTNFVTALTGEAISGHESLHVVCMSGCGGGTGAQGAPNTAANAWPTAPTIGGAVVSSTNPLPTSGQNLWAAGSSNSGQLISPLSLLSTEAGWNGTALAIGGYLQSSIGGTSGIFTNANTGQAIVGDLYFETAAAITPTVGGALSIWWDKADASGNFEPCGATLARPPDAVIPLAAAALSTNTPYYSVGVHSARIPATTFKVCLQNNSGVVLSSAAGNKLMLISPAANY